MVKVKKANHQSKFFFEKKPKRQIFPSEKNKPGNYCYRLIGKTTEKPIWMLIPKSSKKETGKT